MRVDISFDSDCCGCATIKNGRRIRIIFLTHIIITQNMRMHMYKREKGKVIIFYIYHTHVHTYKYREEFSLPYIEMTINL